MIGGIGGIILGMAIGNLIAVQISGTFVIPWFWLMAAITLCTLIGLISGFYPAKKYFLSATPVGPGDDPVFKDDARHPWDETVGRFITEKKFNRMLANLERFNRSRYNLNKNNCTDFALTEAVLAGFNIKQTTGRWPLGKGNNPANAGQSLLEGKFENTDTEYPETLVVNEGQGLFKLN